MLRRLYFVLPGRTAVSAIVDELVASGIDRPHLGIVAHDPAAAEGLGLRVQGDSTDKAARIERILWTSNLLLFAVALATAVGLLFVQGLTGWLAVPLVIIVATLTAGIRFTHVPNTHLNEFTDALRHGELLLMVDVKPAQVADVEDRVHRRHPDAAVGGVGWSSDLLHV